MRCVCVCGVCVHAHIHTYDTYILVSPHGGREVRSPPPRLILRNVRPPWPRARSAQLLPAGSGSNPSCTAGRARRASGARAQPWARPPPLPVPLTRARNPQTARAQGPRPHVHGASSHGPLCFGAARFARFGANPNGPPGSRSPRGRSEAANDEAKRDRGLNNH